MSVKQGFAMQGFQAQFLGSQSRIQHLENPPLRTQELGMKPSVANLFDTQPGQVLLRLVKDELLRMTLTQCYTA